MPSASPTPQDLDRRLTLRTAVARYEELRAQDRLPGRQGDESGDAAPGLTRAEALELVALGEVIANKARLIRQLSVRTARQAGASWTQIGQALGTSKQSAWEAHMRWIDEQARTARREGRMCPDDTTPGQGHRPADPVEDQPTA